VCECWLLLQHQQKSDETETTTTSAQSSETPPEVSAVTTASSTSAVQRQHHQDHIYPQPYPQPQPQPQPQQQQQQRGQRAVVRDERRQWLVLQDRKSRSFDSSFEDRRQLPPGPPAHHPASSRPQRQLAPPQWTGGVDDDDTAADHDVHALRTRRRRLQETQRKSRSLDVYEPTATAADPGIGGGGAATAGYKSTGVSRLRRSSARVTDELPERTPQRLATRFADTATAGTEQRYADESLLELLK